jgi:hypothetical protein
VVGIAHVFWQSASMLHIGAQPGPPEVDVDVELPGPPVVEVEVDAVPVLDVVPEVEVDVWLDVGWPLVVVVGPTDVLPPPPPAPAPCSLLPDAHAAMSPALENAMRTKVVLACFTGVW